MDNEAWLLVEIPSMAKPQLSQMFGTETCVKPWSMARIGRSGQPHTFKITSALNTPNPLELSDLSGVPASVLDKIA